MSDFWEKWDAFCAEEDRKERECKAQETTIAMVQAAQRQGLIVLGSKGLWRKILDTTDFYKTPDGEFYGFVARRFCLMELETNNE